MVDPLKAGCHFAFRSFMLLADLAEASCPATTWMPGGVPSAGSRHRGTLAIAFAFVAVFVFWWQDSHASPRSPLPEVAACIGGMWGCMSFPCVG